MEQERLSHKLLNGYQERENEEDRGDNRMREYDKP